MQETNRALVERMMTMPMLQAEWVLWFLIALSVVSVGIILERSYFLVRHAADVASLRVRLSEGLRMAALRELADSLLRNDTLEAIVLLRGLNAAWQGPDAVEETVRAALSMQRQRYERGLTVLAIVGSNAPFVGLFGTVLGIIHAFATLSVARAEESHAVMAGVSEALIATAIGLLVAIPAVACFNFFKARIRMRVECADQLVRMLLSQLKSDTPSQPERQKAAA